MLQSNSGSVVFYNDKTIKKYNISVNSGIVQYEKRFSKVGGWI